MVKIAFSTSEIIGAAIREITGGEVNHVFFIFFDPVFNAQMTLGANANGLTIEVLDIFPDKIIYIFQPVEQDKGLEIGIRKNIELLNKPYDFQGLFGMVAVELARKLGNWEINNPLQSNRKLFCSEYGKKVLEDSGYNILPDINPGECDPSQLCQALLAVPDQFQSIKVGN